MQERKADRRPGDTYNFSFRFRKKPTLSFPGKKQEKRAFIHHTKLKVKRAVFSSFSLYNAEFLQLPGKASTHIW